MDNGVRVAEHDRDRGVPTALEFIPTSLMSAQVVRDPLPEVAVEGKHAIPMLADVIAPEALGATRPLPDRAGGS